MGAKQRKILQEISNNQNKTDFFCSALNNSFFRKTFFDHIDEEISYPGSLRADFISTVSVSDSRIITTNRRANFNLFWLGVDYWTESVVSPVLESGSLSFESEQLVTIRNPETER